MVAVGLRGRDGEGGQGQSAADDGDTGAAEADVPGCRQSNQRSLASSSVREGSSSRAATSNRRGH